MTRVGDAEFGVSLDLSNLRAEVQRLDAEIRRQGITIPVGIGLDNRQTRAAQQQIENALRKTQVKITPDVDTTGVLSLEDAVKQVKNEANSFSGVIAGFAGGAAFAALDGTINAILDGFSRLIDAGVNFVATSLDVARANQGVENSFRSLGLSASEITEQLNFVRETADRVGLDATEAGRNFANFFAAARTSDPEIAIQDVQDVFRETTRVAAIFGGTQEEINGSLTALTQIASKGTVSMEELRQQLGERLPVAINAAAQGLGITTGELEELVSAGELSAQEFFPAFADGLEQISGDINPVAQAFGRLGNVVGDFQDATGRALQPIQAAIAELLGEIGAATFENLNFDELTASAERLNATLTQNPAIVEQLAEGLSTFAQEAINQLTAIIDALTAFAGNEDAVDGVANAIENLALGLQLVGRTAQGLIGFAEIIASTVPPAREADTALEAIISTVETLPDRLRAAVPALALLITSLENVITQANNAIAALKGVQRLQGTGAGDTGLEGATGTFFENAGEIGQQSQQQESVTAGIATSAIAGVGGETEAEAETAAEALKQLRDEQDSILSEIELRATQSKTALIQDGAGQEEIAAAEQQALRDRLAAYEQFLAELQNLQNSGDLSAEQSAAVGEEIVQTEQAIADARLQIEQGLQRERIRAAQEAAEKITEQIEKQRDAAREAAERQEAAQVEQIEENTADEIERRERALADEIASRELATAERVEKIKRDSQEELQAREERFQEGQRAAAAAFQEQQQRKRAEANREFDVLRSEVDRRLQLETAESPQERRKLEEQFRQQDEEAELRRQIEQEVLNQQSSILSRRGDELEASPLQQAQAEFEAELQAEQAAFAEAQRAAQKAFQKEIEEQKLATEERIEDIKLETEQNIEDLKLKGEEDIANFKEQVEERLQERERAFNEEQRRLDEASAERIARILENAERGIAPSQSLRSGGVAQGGLVQVHKDEFLVPPQGTRVVSQVESRRLIQEALSTAAYQQPLRRFPDIGGGAIADSSISRLLSSAQQSAVQIATNGIEKRLDAVADLLKQTRQDGGQHNIFQLADPTLAARMAADMRRRRQAIARGGY